MADMSPAGRAYRSLGGVALELRKSARTRRPIPAWRISELADAISEAAEILNTARRGGDAVDRDREQITHAGRG